MSPACDDLQYSYRVRFHILQGSHSVFGYPNNRVSEWYPVPIDSDERRPTVCKTFPKYEPTLMFRIYNVLHIICVNISGEGRLEGTLIFPIFSLLLERLGLERRQTKKCETKHMVANSGLTMRKIGVANLESFRYPPPMDAPCPGLQTYMLNRMGPSREPCVTPMLTRCGKFVTWKEEEENKTMLKYVRQRGCKTLQNGEIVMNYHCFRSGTYKPRGKGLKNLKSQGSAKIGTSCPADIREEITVDSGRKMLIEKKDIHNIKRDFNINGYVKRHEIDAVSVKLWAEEMKNGVGSLVVRASDSRPEGLGSMLDVTKYPPSAHGVRAR
ncbi:MULE domain-containing protein [Trichonephila clavipes]|nr:MULE domain-containing protein [Trichonephila clavipes]